MKNKHLTTRFHAWFDTLPIQDPVDRQMAMLVQVILAGFIVVIILSLIFNLMLTSGSVPQQVSLFRSLIFITILCVPLLLLRWGYFRSSMRIIIAIFLILEIYAVNTVNLRAIAETLSFFTLAILLAGLLVGRRALLVVFLVSAGALALEQFAARLEIIHEIDRSLLSTSSLHETARSALARVRKLIPCPRTSVTLFDLEKKKRSFLPRISRGRKTFQ